MRRRIAVGLVLLLAPAATARGQSPAEMQQTASWVASLQTPEGGFAGEPGGSSSLGATSAAIRILGFVEGSIPDVPRCIAYVLSCIDPDSGGFAPSPGARPDVATTAVGLMALAELREADDATVNRAIGYLDDHVRTFEEVRIAVAGLEAVKKPSEKFDAWAATVRQGRNPDGTWSEGASQAFATGGAAVALLRMGIDLDHRDQIIAALKNGQRPDGGWSKDEGPTDLSATYRVARAFFMLNEQPDLDRLLASIARHRRPDGGYAPQPGASPTLGATYFCMIITRWSRLLRGEPAIVRTAGFLPLSRGGDLTGWEGDGTLWGASDGMIVGSSPGLSHNDFLATTGSFGDFLLTLTFRVTGDEEANSGVQFRSVRVPGHEMSGYQADIGQHYWGCLYDESRRNKVLATATEQALATVRRGGWNRYEIRAVGDSIRLLLNGVPSVDYREQDRAIASEGRIALQMHAGGPMKVRFKDIYIQPLPRPSADDAASPGFHVRGVNAPDGRRTYVVYLPEGYDGSKPFPVVLFLHGAGERGDDGIRPSQVGLGPIIAGRPEDFPAIAVFPQARRTWSSGSDDAAGALAALDDVLATFKADPGRVALTGLSMGGAGSWEMAAANPDRFHSVAVVCGFGRPETALKLTGKPVWTFVGDADSPMILRSTRAMTAALREAGSPVRSTEYRAVGHNSWDRAYSDPALIAWLLDPGPPPGEASPD